MAGGSFAEHVTCMVCLDDGKLTRATRTLEGIETDQYRCDAGHEFGLDWGGAPASRPQWPPPEELAAAVHEGNR